MRRLAGAAAAIGACVCLAGFAQAGDPAPTRLLVTGTEFNLTLSRTKLNPGKAITQFYNAGEDPHDLVLQRVGGTRVFALPEVGPGGNESLQMRFRRDSHYDLWCTLENHRSYGMEASVRVRNHRR